MFNHFLCAACVSCSERIKHINFIYVFMLTYCTWDLNTRCTHMNDSIQRFWVPHWNTSLAPFECVSLGHWNVFFGWLRINSNSNNEKIGWNFELSLNRETEWMERPYEIRLFASLFTINHLTIYLNSSQIAFYHVFNVSDDIILSQLCFLPSRIDVCMCVCAVKL